MSPYDAWKQAIEASFIRLPAASDELDVVCSDSVTCTLTVKGVVLENCTFNSPHLQAILRDAPRQPTKKAGAGIPVEVHVNRTLMDAIWVRDPRTRERLRVANIDPAKACLSAYQISAAIKVQKEAEDQGKKIALGQAIQRTRDAARELQRANTQSARRRALKLMGLALDDEPSAEVVQSSRKRKVRQSSRVGNRSSVLSSRGDDSERIPLAIVDHGEVQRLSTVIRPPHHPKDA